MTCAICSVIVCMTCDVARFCCLSFCSSDQGFALYFILYSKTFYSNMSDASAASAAPADDTRDVSAVQVEVDILHAAHNILVRLRASEGTLEEVKGHLGHMLVQ